MTSTPQTPMRARPQPPSHLRRDLWLVAGAIVVAWAALAGAVWLAGRVWYAAAYSVPGRNRGPGFALGLLALAVLLLMAFWGVTWTLVFAG